MICYSPPVVRQCSALWNWITVDCIWSYDHDGPLGSAVPSVENLASVILLGFAALCIWNPQRGWITLKNRMRWIICGYSLITAVFGFMRSTIDISKPLLVGAAIHNLFEWLMIANAYTREATVWRRYAVLASGWIYLVSAMVFLAVPFHRAVLVEQVPGILCDFLNVWVFLDLQQQDSLYWKPFVATVVHLFGTIIPLVLANFLPKNLTSVQVVLNLVVALSVAVTYYLHWQWANEYDARYSTPAGVPARVQIQSRAPRGRRRSRASEPDDADEDQSESEDLLAGSCAAVYPSAKRAQAQHFWAALVVSFVLGIFTLTAYPSFVPPCPGSTTPQKPVQAPDTAESCPAQPWKGEGLCYQDAPKVIGTSPAIVRPGYAEAFKTYLYQLNWLETARAFPGNIRYDIYQSTKPGESNVFQFYAEWENAEAATKWVMGLPAQEFPKIAFMLKPGTKLDPLHAIKLEHCAKPKVRYFAYGLPVNQSIDEVWSVFANASDCRWLPHCMRVEPLNERENRYIFGAADNKGVYHEAWNATFRYQLFPENYTYSYVVLPEGGFENSFTLTKNTDPKTVGKTRIDTYGHIGPDPWAINISEEYWHLMYEATPLLTNLFA